MTSFYSVPREREGEKKKDIMLSGSGALSRGSLRCTYTGMNSGPTFFPPLLRARDHSIPATQLRLSLSMYASSILFFLSFFLSQYLS